MDREYLKTYLYDDQNEFGNLKYHYKVLHTTLTKILIVCKFHMYIKCRKFNNLRKYNFKRINKSIPPQKHTGNSFVLRIDSLQ